MKRVAIADLKSHLSQYLSRVKEGEELLVTSTGKTIARIIPVEPREHSIEQLEQLGIVKAGKKGLPKGFWSRPRPDDPHGSLREALTQERGEGR
jgi:prevent-host-death family protein